MGKVDLKIVLEIRWDGPWEVRPIDVNVDFTLTPTCGQGNTTVSATPINQYSNDWGGKVEIFYYEYSDLVNTEIECVGVSDCEGGYVQYGKVESGSTVVGLIPASGGTATTTIGNGGQYYTKANGETGKTHDIIPCDISGNPMTSFTATASSRGTEVGEEKVISSTTVMKYGEDYQKVSGIVEVRQAENKAELVSTTVTEGKITVATIPASGGNGTTIISNGKYDEVTTYSSNDTAITKSGGVVNPDITEFTAYANSLGLVTSQTREVSSTTVTWTKNGVSKTKKAVVKQEANTVEHVDNEVVLSVSASTTSLANTKNAAATLTISCKIISGDLYKSGQFSATSETNIPSSDIEVSIDNTTDFILSGNTLLTANVNKNVEINECIVTASYVLNGKPYSSSITIKQVGTPAKYNFNVLYNTQSVKDKAFKYENISGYTFKVHSTKSGESKTNGSFSEGVNWRLTANGNSLVYINEGGQWVEYNGDFISAEAVHVGEIQPKSTKSLWVKPILNNLTFTNNLSTILTFSQEGNNGGTVETRIMYIRIGQQHQPYRTPMSLGIVLGGEASKFWETYNQGNHSNSMGFKGKVGFVLTDGTNHQDVKATFDVLCRWESTQNSWESIIFPNAVMCDLESLSFSEMQSCSIIDHGCAFYEGSGYTQSNIDMQYYLALVVDGECKSTIPGEGIARLCTLSTQGNVAFNDNLELYPTPYDTCSYLEVAGTPFVEGSQVMLCVVISSMKNWDQAFSTGTTGTIVSSYENNNI